jgi:hypothetical protein
MKPALLLFSMCALVQPTDKTFDLESGGEIRIHCDGAHPIELYVTDVEGRYTAVRLTPDEAVDVATTLEAAAQP